MVKKVPERTPAEKRIGPLVICHLTGLPPTDARCRRFFPQGRHPDAVWNMDACAGANTEADVAGATIEERMAMSMHTTMENSERCLRKLEPALHRAAAKRTAYRMRPSGTEDGE
jgi:hypothetical protein